MFVHQRALLGGSRIIPRIYYRINLILWFGFSHASRSTIQRNCELQRFFAFREDFIREWLYYSYFILICRDVPLKLIKVNRRLAQFLDEEAFDDSSQACVHLPGALKLVSEIRKSWLKRHFKGQSMCN